MFRALKNVSKSKVERLLKNKSFNKLVNSIKRRPSNSEKQVKELISCLIEKLTNSFENLSKVQKTQAVAQFIHFLLKKKSIRALNSISERSYQNINIKESIRDIEIFERHNNNLTAVGREYFSQHIIIIIGKAFFNASEKSQDDFWGKSIQREGSQIDNLDYHTEKILEKISLIQTIICNSDFI